MRRKMYNNANKKTSIYYTKQLSKRNITSYKPSKSVKNAKKKREKSSVLAVIKWLRASKRASTESSGHTGDRKSNYDSIRSIVKKKARQYVSFSATKLNQSQNPSI